MIQVMNKTEIEQLRNHLIVPLAVSDILYHDLNVEPDMQYGLHMALSEIDPDSALLAMALAAMDLAEKNLIYAPIASALKTEAETIISEYGPTWLHHHCQGPMPEEIYLQILRTVPEDLEALADLMDALCADLDLVDEATPILCNLFSVQARAHMEIAEFILTENALDSQERAEFSLDHLRDINVDFEIENKANGYDADNVIMFPCGTNG